ncbi:fimbria/pilus outer membrane usher protein [Pseudomonas sp. Irchel 3H7]|uniref:fimbria/pilus outer membrane usher protein n=1 Tax=Pseudomonas sp. Irchel 3H7 TaxID=2009042 RepID=UPI001C444BF3|nr:fimbria/pilus outer membrane usher protein [Pseudomonas sp. Irchel 3H7]
MKQFVFCGETKTLPRNFKFALNLSFVMLSSCVFFAAKGFADEQASFNRAFTEGRGGHPIDLSRFERGNPVTPGNYQLDVYVNQIWVARDEVRIMGSTQSETATFCFRREQLSAFGLDLAKISGQKPTQQSPVDSDCVNIEKDFPESRIDFNLGDLRVDLSIPQAFLKRVVRGYVEPESWESGVTAGFIDYNANTYRTSQRGQLSTQTYVGVNSGLNLGDWRIRHSGNYTQSSGDRQDSKGNYQVGSSYVQRDLTSLKSQLTIGEYYTPSELFDSVPYTGIQLSSDDRMLPDSQRGFAPEIRGTAESNAKVVVKQGNNILYETNVAPGPFVINDLYNSGYAGDLDVTVTEADGRARSFTVPFASVAQLLRPGTSRYSVVAGKYRDDQLAYKPNFVQGTYQRGLSNHWTGYTGSIISDQYLAVQGGLALSTSFGALAFDVTHSNATELPASSGMKSSSSGKSYRLAYSKVLESTKTNFAVAAYRFSSDGYLGFSDYASTRSLEGDLNGHVPHRQRNRFQVNVNQPLPGKLGSFYLSGSAQNYWNTESGSDTSYQAGYSNNFSWGSMSLSASRTQTPYGEDDTRYMLSVSMPLGRSARAPYLSASSAYSQSGDVNNQLSISGSLGEFNQTHYGVYGSQSISDGERSKSSGANLQHRAPLANLQAGFSNGENYRQASFGVSGSIVAHPGGVNFTQAQGETRAIVEAKGAEGAALLNSSGARVGSNGYGVVSSLSPYRNNQVSLDSRNISDDVELQTTSQNVAPRYGAVVQLKYKTQTGKPLLLHLTDKEGQSLPVGAEVQDEQGNSLTLVGQGSRVFVRSEKEKGKVIVLWGDRVDQSCEANYMAPESKEKSSSILKVKAICSPRVS